MRDAKARGIELKMETLLRPSNATDISVASTGQGTVTFFLRVTRPDPFSWYEYRTGALVDVPNARAISLSLRFDFDVPERGWLEYFNGSALGGSDFGLPPYAALSYQINMGYPWYDARALLNGAYVVGGQGYELYGLKIAPRQDVLNGRTDF